MDDVCFTKYNYTNFNDNNNNSQKSDNVITDNQNKDLLIYEQQKQILDLKSNLEQLKTQHDYVISILNLVKIDADISKINFK
jgi:hypothetical protein